MNPEPIIAYLNDGKKRGGAARLAAGAGVRESVVNYWRNAGHIPHWRWPTIKNAFNLPPEVVAEAKATSKQ